MRPTTKGLPKPLLTDAGVAAFGADAGAGAGAGADVDLAAVGPKPPNEGAAGGAAGVDAFATSDCLLALLCPNPEKPLEPKGVVAAGLASDPEEPRADWELPCWKEKGLFLFAADTDGFSGEPLGVSSELLRGAAAKGELLLGALELKPRNEPDPDEAGAGATLTGAAPDGLVEALLTETLGCATALLDVSCDELPALTEGPELFKFANENAGASLLCVAPDAGAEPKPPKLPKPAGLVVVEVCVGAALLLKENGELGFCDVVGAVLPSSVLLETSAAGAKEKGDGDAGFASALSAAGLEGKERGEAIDFAGVPEKLKDGFAGSTAFFSASVPGADESGFLGSTSDFGASSAFTGAEPMERELELGVGEVVLGLVFPKEKGWLPNVAPALKPGLRELNAG